MWRAIGKLVKGRTVNVYYIAKTKIPKTNEGFL